MFNKLTRKKFEYLRVIMGTLNTDKFNELGLAGWELVLATRSHYLFKREL